MYGAGLSTQRMSLDMGVALSTYCNRAFEPYDFKKLVHSGRVLQAQFERYNVTDLFEIPVPMLDETDSLIPWSSLASDEFSPERLARHVFVDETFAHTERFEEFLGRRELAVTDLNLMYETADLLDLASRRNFCNAMPLFYVEEEKRRNIMQAIRQVIPKQIYRQAAAKITVNGGFPPFVRGVIFQTRIIPSI